ncbi:ABC-2 type transporter-domain-containing protein [Gaertneriomyces semiglobifer]|nr:ABC-2 type transporter-domain-containing protein [Gaertneriomyces semiglobifer]
MLWGFVWFRMGVNSAGVQNRIGAIFFISVNQVFGTMMPVVVLFPSQRPIVKRERAAGSYSASAAYISRLLSSIPLLYISLILLCVPGYWMIGFQANANNFFIYLLTVAVLTFTSLCLGACIGSAAPNFRMAALIVPLLTVLFVLFCGQMVNLDTVTPALRWIQYVSPIAWTQKALSQNEFSGLVFDCSVDDIGCIPTGETALAVYKLDGIGLWTCIGINFAMGVGLLLLGYYMYKRTTRPAIRLEAIRKHN